MEMIRAGSLLWNYLSSEQRELNTDGQWLLDDRREHPSEQLSDYSYLVFPFAKLYEGFLKQLFRDVGIITDRDYLSDHFRLGKALSPNIARRLGRKSAYAEVSQRYSQALADKLWHAWKQGRNLTFHYFPHNYRRLTFSEAKELISLLVATMEEAVRATGVRPS